MSVIGTLTAIVSAQTAPFEQGMKRTQSAMGVTSNKAAATGTAVQGLTTKLLGVASAAGLAYKGISTFFGSMNRLDDIGDTADNLGVLPSKLQELHFAAEQSGSSATDMNTALATMVKNTADAAMGVGRAKKFIAELGLDAQRLKQQAPDQMFRSFANAIAAVENPAVRTQMAMKIFGDQGKTLAALLGEGKSGVDALAESARAAGIVIGDENVRAAQGAADAWKALQATWDGITANIAAALMPALESISSWLVKHPGAVKAMGFALGALGAVMIITATKTMIAASAMAVMKIAAMSGPGAIFALAAATAVAGAAVVAFTRNTDKAIAKAKEQAKATQLNVAALQKETKATKDAAAAKDKKDTRKFGKMGSAVTAKEVAKRAADRPQALSGSEAINQFLINSQTAVNPMRDLAIKHHRENIAKLDEMRLALSTYSPRVGVF